MSPSWSARASAQRLHTARLVESWYALVSQTSHCGSLASGDAKYIDDIITT